MHGYKCKSLWQARYRKPAKVMAAGKGTHSSERREGWAPATARTATGTGWSLPSNFILGVCPQEESMMHTRNRLLCTEVQARLSLQEPDSPSCCTFPTSQMLPPAQHKEVWEPGHSQPGSKLRLWTPPSALPSLSQNCTQWS